MASSKKPTARATATKGEAPTTAKGKGKAVEADVEVEAPPRADMTEQLKASFAQVPLVELRPDPQNRTLVLDDEFAASIAAEGVLEPILIRPVPPKGKVRYEIVAGERRYAAATKAGHKTIPAMVAEMSDARAALLQATENLKRRNLTPREECAAIARVIQFGVGAKELAERIGESEQWVKNRIKVLSLPPLVFKSIEAGDLSFGTAVRLAGAPEKVIEKASKMTHGRMTDYWVKDAIDAHEKSEKLAKLKKKLKDQGLKVVGSAPQTWGDNGARRVETMFGSDLAGAIKAHGAQPCHVVSIESFSMKPVHWCIDPNSHLGAENATGLVAAPVQRPMNSWEKPLTPREKYAEEVKPETKLLEALIEGIDPTAKPPAAAVAHAMVWATNGFADAVTSKLGYVKTNDGPKFKEWLAGQRPNVVAHGIVLSMLNNRPEPELVDALAALYEIDRPVLPTFEEWLAQYPDLADAHAADEAAWEAVTAILDDPDGSGELDGEQYDMMLERMSDELVAIAATRIATRLVAAGRPVPDWVNEWTDDTEATDDGAHELPVATEEQDAVDGADEAEDAA